MDITITVEQLADVIMAHGTIAVREELEALADAARATQPGAAAALTDWEGTEIARERAFAVIRAEQRHHMAASPDRALRVSLAA